MRDCAKLGCKEPAAATVGLRYAERILWIGDLLSQRDPNLIDLCQRHTDTLVGPYGWSRLDERAREVKEAPLTPIITPIESEASAPRAQADHPASATA
ncbi:MAG: DUF3499 family protein [Actinomycetota bacterium]|nr:DUF3499 family protein [Actinomycetota bacterium]